MKTKQHPLWFRALAAFMAALVVAVSTPTVYAVDTQALPENTRAATGFTHTALVTWDDLNNNGDLQTVTVQLGAIPTNCYIDRIGFNVEQVFTNATAASTNLCLALGVGGSTNRFYQTNYIDGGYGGAGGRSPQAYVTNLLVPYFATTSTNYVIASFVDGANTSTVDDYTYGKIRIFWRLVQPSKIK